MIEHTDPDLLQRDSDVMIDLFGKVGLETNETKTKYIVLRGWQHQEH